METRKCAVCGKEYTPIRKNQIVCSEECRAEHTRAYNRAYERKPIDKACPICGKRITTRRVYCSAACRMEAKVREDTAAKFDRLKNLNPCDTCGLDCGKPCQRWGEWFCARWDDITADMGRKLGLPDKNALKPWKKSGKCGKI